MFEIKQVDYHYYHQLTEGLNNLESAGYTVIQILEHMTPSGNVELMHRDTVLVKKNWVVREVRK